MHTYALTPEMFDVYLEGRPSTIQAICPNWHRYDRFGIVIHEAWGSTGASLLIQAAIAEFYRARRAQGISDIYPEFWAFHIGKDHGNNGVYDIWPFHKEVVLPVEPAKILQAIIDRGITRLAVPDGPSHAYDFIWPELIAVKDHMETVIAYGAAGYADEADFEIRSSAEEPLKNTARTLNQLGEFKDFADTDLPDVRRFVGHVYARLDCVSPADTARAVEWQKAKLHDSTCIETYRRVDLDYALGRLVP